MLFRSINAGEIHAIMGPNGAGKSTLSYVLGGRLGYEVTEGSVSFTPSRHPGLEPGSRLSAVEGSGTPAQGRGDEGGEAIDLLALDPHERAAAGLFLGFRYPVEIPGGSIGRESGRERVSQYVCNSGVALSLKT